MADGENSSSVYKWLSLKQGMGNRGMGIGIGIGIGKGKGEQGNRESLKRGIFKRGNL